MACMLKSARALTFGSTLDAVEAGAGALGAPPGLWECWEPRSQLVRRSLTRRDGPALRLSNFQRSLETRSSVFHADDQSSIPAVPQVPFQVV